MKYGWWFATALLLSPMVRAQQIENVKPVPKAPIKMLLSKPVGVARETASAARDFVTFRDPSWSLLTFAQIAAASADAATSLNDLHACSTCKEVGASRYFVGRHPDAHKYVLGGAIEIGVEAVAAHYFRSHGPSRKWYWKALWTLPQSLSLYEHARAAGRNAVIDLR